MHCWYSFDCDKELHKIFKEQWHIKAINEFIHSLNLFLKERQTYIEIKNLATLTYLYFLKLYYKFQEDYMNSWPRRHKSEVVNMLCVGWTLLHFYGVFIGTQSNGAYFAHDQSCGNNHLEGWFAIED